MKEENTRLKRELSGLENQLSKSAVSEQSISERYEGSLLKLQEDNAELHSQITRLKKQNKSLQEQVDYLRAQLDAFLARKGGPALGAGASFM